MINRRTILAAAASLAAIRPSWGSVSAARRTGRLKQGVTRQIFGQRPLEDCCKLAARLGISGFDFICDPKDWPVLRQYGITMSMYRLDYGGGISIGRSPAGPPGWNAIGMKQAQGEHLEAMLGAIDIAAREGFPNIIALAGSREEVSYEEGADNAVAFFDAVKSKAESAGVTLCMELLNSKGRMAPPKSLFDHAEWGFEVVRRVNSPRVKVLYDIWHAQLMDGNIVDTIHKNIGLIGHFHTGGVPDRHELFRDNELDYRFIAQAIADLDFGGFVTHEWSPAKDADMEEDLRRSVALMNVCAPGSAIYNHRNRP
jgi:hydroxypyruvate isomerase